MKALNKTLFVLPLLGACYALSSCDLLFKDDGAWKVKFGTPELLLENARDEGYVFQYEGENSFKDLGNKVREAIKLVAPFQPIDAVTPPSDARYFTYEADHVSATSGPNYEHLSIWQNGFVRIDPKKSLGPHRYLYFSIAEEKASPLVQMVFSHGNVE